MLELTNVLGKHYDNKFFLSTDIYSNILKTKGILVFKDFISKTILNEMVIEANLLKSKSFQSTSNYNVYVKPQDLAYPTDSARNRIMNTTKKCVPNDLISDKSFLMKIYNSSKIQRFFCSILGVKHLYPYADKLSSVNINYYEPGDALDWHFDNSDFTITLGKTYTHMRSTISSTFKVTGTVTVGSETCNTVASPSVASTATLTAKNATDGTLAEMEWIIPNTNGGGDYSDLTSSFAASGTAKVDGASTFTFTIALAVPYTPKSTDVPKIRMAFNVADTLTATESGGTCVMYLTPPIQTVTISR